MTSLKRSSQRQRDLEISRLKGEEFEKHEADECIDRQRLEIETQPQLQKWEIQ